MRSRLLTFLYSKIFLKTGTHAYFFEISMFYFCAKLFQATSHVIILHNLCNLFKLNFKIIERHNRAKRVRGGLKGT